MSLLPATQEPDRRISRFLSRRGRAARGLVDEGHHALSQLRDNGMEFLQVPESYYDVLRDRIGKIDESLEAIRSLGILVDRDEDGYLLQIFSQPVEDRPTLFFEIIQRKGVVDSAKAISKRCSSRSSSNRPTPRNL